MRLRGIVLGAIFATSVWWAAQGGAPADLGGPGSGPLTTPQPAAISEGRVTTYTVQPGDTLWSIARRVQSEGDLRPLVDRLTATRGGRPLQIGEELNVPLDV